MAGTVSLHRCLIYLFLSGLLCVLGMSSGCSRHLTQKEEFLVGEKTLPENWSMNGRLSISMEDENWYSAFYWVQQGNDFYIRFMGPLGQTELELRQQGESVLLKTPSYERSSDDLEQLLWRETGWKFPLQSMRFWAMGRTNPNESARVERSEQYITGIKQSGWDIEYSRYTQVNELLLPKKIIVSDPEVNIKIIVTHWSLDTNAIPTLSQVR